MDWLQDVLASLLVLAALSVVSGAVWFIKSRREESRAAQQRLNSERRDTYRKILSPYIGILTGLKDKAGTAKAVAVIQSQGHKQAVFDLVFFGSDNVVKAHSALFQYAYKGEASESAEQRGIMFMRLWGRLLLEIRKDVGNKDTKLDELDVLRWLITDIDKLEHSEDPGG